MRAAPPSPAAPEAAPTGNHLGVPRAGENPNLLSPEILSQRRGECSAVQCAASPRPCAAREALSAVTDNVSLSPGSRRPSILPVPDMFTSSALNISTDNAEDEGDESEDEVDDDVPWRSPSEKIA